MKKLAIWVPEAVLAQMDRAAARSGQTRSKFIARVLRQVARACGDAEITARIDPLFGDPDIGAQQSRAARALRAAAPARGWEW